jgi:hypothetical protein
MRQRQLLTTADGKPAETQHAHACSDCPFARDSVPAWLGGYTVQETLESAHGEARIDCHILHGAQCAGAAIYRANTAKRPRDRNLLELPADRKKVFATPIEFTKHHGGKP